MTNTGADQAFQPSVRSRTYTWRQRGVEFAAS
jgi:hypothetical protein